MALIYLTTTAEESNWNHHALDNFNRIVSAAQHSTSTKHAITDSVDDADIILFIGSKHIYHSDILNSDIYKQYTEKCLIFDCQDITIPRLPGLYANIPAYLHQYPIYEYAFYITFDDWAITERVDFSQCQYLFSFIGDASTYPKVRLQVLNLSHSRSYLKDTSVARMDYKIYANSLNLSKFVLCPRGIAPSSVRVFETMRQGRVPVIISDEWTEPIGAEWSEFSVRISENDISSIPCILEALEYKAEEMGQKALEYWEANFSLEKSLEWLVEAALRIQSCRQEHKNIIARHIYSESFNRQHFTIFWKEVVRKITNRI